MNIPHKQLSVDINRKNQYTVDFIGHVNDKDVRYIDVTFNAGGTPITLEEGCTATVTYVSEGVLIDQAAVCTVNGSTVVIGVDSEKVENLRSGILEVQPKVVDLNGRILTMQIPILVRISPDIAEHGQVDDDSLGSYAEVVREIAAARGDYPDLKDRLDHTGAPTDEQVATAVSEWLDDHPEATTTVEDGAVTAAKLGSGAVTAAKLGSDVNTILDGKVSKPSTSPNGTNGQLLRTKGDGTTEWVDVGLPTDAQTAEAVSDWLDDHPEATTTVEDGSITTAKLHSGVIDNSLSTQGAAAEAKTTGHHINVLTDRETALDGIVSQEWEIGRRDQSDGAETWYGGTTRISNKRGTYIRFLKDDLIVVKKTLDFQFFVVYSTDNGSTWASTSFKALPYSIPNDSIGWICVKKASNGSFTAEEMQSFAENYVFILRKSAGETKKNALLADALSIASNAFDRSQVIVAEYGITNQSISSQSTAVTSADLLLPEFEASKGDVFAIKASVSVDYPDTYSGVGIKIFEKNSNVTVKSTQITDLSDVVMYTVSNANTNKIHITGLALVNEGAVTTGYREIFDYKISVVKKIPGEIDELLTEAGDIWEV